MAYNSDVAVQGINFDPDGGFSLTYAEREDFNVRGTIIRQIMVPAGIAAAQVEEVREALKELLDLALIERYDDPAERLSRR